MDTLMEPSKSGNRIKTPPGRLRMVSCLINRQETLLLLIVIDWI